MNSIDITETSSSLFPPISAETPLPQLEEIFKFFEKKFFNIDYNSYLIFKDHLKFKNITITDLKDYFSKLEGHLKNKVDKHEHKQIVNKVFDNFKNSVDILNDLGCKLDGVELLAITLAFALNRFKN